MFITKGLIGLIDKPFLMKIVEYQKIAQVSIVFFSFITTWYQKSYKLSNLISTIALTYTLLGISLGIGELSSSKLEVDTINQTISRLTEQFSMAFMTSVIGLPLSGILRSVLIIYYEHSRTNILNQITNLKKLYVYN